MHNALDNASDTALDDASGTLVQKKTGRHALTTVLAVVSVLLVLGGMTLVASRAFGVFEKVAETGTAGYISVSADNHLPRNAVMVPGDTSHWLLKVSLSDAKEGTLSVALHADGGLVTPVGMTAQVHTCTGSFTYPEKNRAKVPSCSGDLVEVLHPTPLSSIATGEKHDVYKLANILANKSREFLVTLQIPADASPDSVAGEKARIGVEFNAAGGDTANPPITAPPLYPPGTRLPVTGSDLIPLAVLGAGLIGLAILTALRRHPQTQQAQLESANYSTHRAGQ